MTDFNRTESARFAQENQKIVGELHAGVDKALAEAASRGFPAPPGATLAIILEAGQAAKDKLVEGNAKIYDERRKVLFEQDEFAMKMIVSLAKLGMELYREELMNALAIEQAENLALRDLGNADVIRMNAEVDKRQVTIIQARAEMERQITVLKAQLVTAEELTLVSEAALINAQLATAEKKLEIIDSIYQVLAAEELVLEAENRRAATLVVLLAAEMVVAGVKREMVPFYIEKAGARMQLANAITQEIPIQKAIVELGYDRIDLKTTEEYATHLTREAEEEVALAQMAWTRANKATEFTRMQSRRLLQDYSNIVRAEILAKKKSLEQDGIDFKLTTSLARQAIGINNDVAISAHDVINLGIELGSILSNLSARATDEAKKVKASAHQISMSDTSHLISREIIEGSILGFIEPGTMGYEALYGAGRGED
jgi:hypothetical protein